MHSLALGENMVNLDDIVTMKKLDPTGVLASTEMFPDQCMQAWEESSNLKFPKEYKQVENIVVCGMGGSRFTPKTIKELFRDRIKVPYEIVEDYTLPDYVGSNSLVILSSYSGSTEEVISCQEEALRRKAKVTAVSKGGKIAQEMQKKRLPAYIFDAKYNPCGQPRIGGGYLLMGHLGILFSLGAIKIDNDEVANGVNYIRKLGKKLSAQTPAKKNPAKTLATVLKDKHLFIITAEFLKGFGNGFANQVNETAKLISDYRYIPELNHHLMEGLKRPDSLHKNGLFVFIVSNLYSPPVKKRFAITKEVVSKQNISWHDITLSGKTKLDQVLGAFTLSGFTTFYLAMLYDTDPVAIPWVDYFKAQLIK